MKENKTVKIEVRLTVDEKAFLKDYAQAHNLTMSELVRQALIHIMKTRGPNNGD